MLLFHFTIALFTDAVILLSYHVPQYQTLLNDLTREEGFYETATVVFFLATAVLALYALARKGDYNFGRRQKIILLCVSALFCVAALEEISWGQRILNYEAGRFFLSYNIQEEVNVHNLVPGVVFNTIVFTIIYAFFIILPLVSVLFFQDGMCFFPRPMTQDMPSLDIVLLFLFGVSIHSYRAEYPVEYLSMAIQMACLLGFAYLIFSRKFWGGTYVIFNFLLLILSIVVFWWHGEILLAERTGGSDELREFVLSYAFFFWFYGWSGRYRSEGRDEEADC